MVGFGLEVLGVALATVLSQIVSAVLVMLVLCRPDSIFCIERKQIRFHPDILKSILRIGLPTGLQSDMYTISNMLIQSCINSFGTSTMAAWTAFCKLDAFYWMISGAFGISITTFVGQNFGAQRYDRVRKSVRVCLLLSLVTALLVSGLYALGAQPLLRMFSTDTQVIEIGTFILWRMSPFYFTFICVEVMAGAIRGTGDSLKPMLLTCGGVCVLRVVWIFTVLPLDRTLGTLLLSYPMTWSITSLLFIIYYVRGNWMRRQIQKYGFSEEHL